MNTHLAKAEVPPLYNANRFVKDLWTVTASLGVMINATFTIMCQHLTTLLLLIKLMLFQWQENAKVKLGNPLLFFNTFFF